MPVRPGFSGWKGYTVSGFRFRVSGRAGQHSDIGQPAIRSRKSATNCFSDYGLPTTVFPETGNRKPETGNRKPETGNRKPETGNRDYVVGHANAVSAGGCSSRLFASTDGAPPSCHS